MKTRRPSRAHLLHDRRGAVLAEFVVALVPMLMAFFGFFQVAMMITAKMLVRHSAIIGARAASVVEGGGDSNPTADGAPQGTRDDINAAVTQALGRWGTNGMLTAGAPDVSDTGGPNGTVTVRVKATFQCNTPLGGRLVCGGGKTLSITDEASMPKQGADYQ